MHLATFVNCISEMQARDHRPDAARTIKAVIECGGQQITAAVKTSPPRRMAAEFTAAHVATLLSVPCVAPYIVTVNAHDVAAHNLKGGLINSSDGSVKLFGTEFSMLPAAQPINTFGQEVPAWLPPTIVFDVLVGNVDRADKNILASESNWTLIDHDQIFLSRDWTAGYLNQHQQALVFSGMDTNLTLVCVDGLASPVATDILHLATAWQGKLTQTSLSSLTELCDLGLIDNNELQAICAFLIARSAHLHDLTKATLVREL